MMRKSINPCYGLVIINHKDNLMPGSGKATKTLSFGGSGMFKQYGKDDAPGIPVGPNGVLGLSIGFVAVVLVLHIIGKFF